MDSINQNNQERRRIKYNNNLIEYNIQQKKRNYLNYNKKNYDKNINVEYYFGGCSCQDNELYGNGRITDFINNIRDRFRRPQIQPQQPSQTILQPEQKQEQEQEEDEKTVIDEETKEEHKEHLYSDSELSTDEIIKQNFNIYPNISTKKLNIIYNTIYRTGKQLYGDYFDEHNEEMVKRTMKIYSNINK